MNFQQKVRFGIIATTSVLVIGLATAPSLNHVLNLTTGPVQTAVPTEIKASNQTVSAVSSAAQTSSSAKSVKSRSVTSKTNRQKSTSQAATAVSYVAPVQQTVPTTAPLNTVTPSNVDTQAPHLAPLETTVPTMQSNGPATKNQDTLQPNHQNGMHSWSSADHGGC